MPLPENQIIRLETIQSGYLRIVYPQHITAESLDDFYSRYLEALKASPQLVCVVGDFSLTTETNLKAAMRSADLLPSTKPYLKKVAVCCLPSFFQNMFLAIVLISQREDIRIFKTRDDAEAWAYKDMTH